jgi:hypothetical protein
MRCSIGAGVTGWDATRFRQTVQSALAEGRFTLIIAIDDIEGERLTKGIAFLQHHGLTLPIRVLRVDGNRAELLPPFEFGNRD